MSETDELVLAMDPGGVTGWSLWQYPHASPAMRLNYGLIKNGLDGFLYWSERNLGVIQPSLIIFERFNPDLGYGKSKDYQALEIQGAIKAMARALGIDLMLHDNSMKALCRDDDLERLNFWISPEQAKVDPAILHVDGRDVNDSQIHALAHAKAVDHEPTVTEFWPPITL